METKKSHTFAVCAYKESPFLEECILSLKRQTVSTNIILSTSTPNEHIQKLAEKYEIPLYINAGEKGITQDWNFAYNQVKTDYVTIAHQDDLYDKHYAEYFLKMIENERKPLIFFTDYYELRNGQVVKSNILLRIKRLFLFPMRFRCVWRSRFIRRRILSFGSFICCPSVTLVKKNILTPVFLNHFKSNEDWEAWERISRMKGSFVFCNRPLTYHRIHEASETSAIIGENRRGMEDYEMFCKFWPSWVAKILAKMYSRSEKSNVL